MAEIKAIVFDLGGVLIDWNPRYVYRQIFGSEQEVEWFLNNITTNDWNENQDAGYPLHKGTKELIAKHPEWTEPIKAYYGRWLEMLGDAFSDTLKILKQLKDSERYKLYVLTNWSAELFPHARQKFEFLNWFDGIVVSGEEKIRKPFAEIYQLLLQRYLLQPESTIFIDDSLRNVKAAEQLGIKAILFTSANKLQEDLRRLQVI
ncbi:MAG: HAD family hydrolase [Chitinophagaceae bacterium]